jgi:hypothetical protein
VSSKRSKSQTRHRQSGGRTTPKSSTRSSSSRSTSTAASGAKSTKGDKAARRDLNVRSVDRLVAQTTKALPKAKVRSAFTGTTGISPNAVTIYAAVPAVAIVGIGTAVHQPLLLLVAALAMAATIFGLMKFVNATRVVAELPNELVLLSSRRGQLEPILRTDPELELRPYRDRRWMRVVVADEQLWVSRRAYGTIVERLAGLDGDG